MPKVYKVEKGEEIAQVIQKIKSFKEREAVLEVDKGASILSNSANLRLIRKTAEVLGKKILLKTEDELGQVLAVKAGMPLYGERPIRMPKSIRPPRVPKGKFSDIKPKPSRIEMEGIETEEETAGIVPSKDALTKPVMISEAPASADQVRFKKIGSKPPQRPVPMAQRMPAMNLPPRPLSGPPPKRSWFRISKEFSKIFILVAVVLVVAVFGLAVLLPQAEISVYARSEPITRDLEITVDKNTRSFDSAKQIIPGEIITKELNHTKTFQTTGTKLVGEKAAGSVVIYNFTKNTLTLRAATTTLVINGKKYFFTKDATGIRPTGRIGTGEEQEVDRSTLTAPIPIVAENPGQDYNLPVNQKFVLQNTALGDNPNVYAVNEVLISGGSATTVKILSQADVDRATNQITEELAGIAEEQLADNGAAKKVLSTGSNTEILAKTADRDVGAEAAEFDMTVIGRLTGLAYNEDDIKNLMVEKIMSVLTEDKYLLQDGKRDVSARYKSVDLGAGRGVLSVHFETVVAYKIENENLAGALAGKNASEIKEILLTKPEIDRVDVKFSPFFVNKAPRYNGKIFIETKLSES